MDLLTQKKLTDRLFEVMKEFNLNPSHIQCSLNEEDHTKRLIAIFFGIKFDKNDFEKEKTENERNKSLKEFK